MNRKAILSAFFVGLFALVFFGCGDGTKPVNDDGFKAYNLVRGDDWEVFKHDVSSGAVWNVEGAKPRLHKTPKGANVYWNGEVLAQELQMADDGISNMLAACRRDVKPEMWQPVNRWRDFRYFTKHPDFHILLVESNYTLQEGEARGCKGIITGAGGAFTACGTVGGMILVNNRPAARGGVYIIVPKLKAEDLSRPPCVNLWTSCIKHESEHLIFSNDLNIFNAYANDGLNGNHPYCTGTE